METLDYSDIQVLWNPANIQDADGHKSHAMAIGQLSRLVDIMGQALQRRETALELCPTPEESREQLAEEVGQVHAHFRSTAVLLGAVTFGTAYDLPVQIELRCGFDAFRACICTMVKATDTDTLSPEEAQGEAQRMFFIANAWRDCNTASLRLATLVTMALSGRAAKAAEPPVSQQEPLPFLEPFLDPDYPQTPTPPADTGGADEVEDPTEADYPLP